MKNRTYPLLEKLGVIIFRIIDIKKDEKILITANIPCAVSIAV